MTANIPATPVTGQDPLTTVELALLQTKELIKENLPNLCQYAFLRVRTIPSLKNSLYPEK